MRRPLLILLLLLLLVVGAYSVWWQHAAGQVRTRFEDWAADLHSQGGAVAHAGLEIGGFPFSLVAQAADVTLRLPDGPTWQGSAVVAEAAPWDLTEVAFRLPGAQELRLPADGIRPEVIVTAKDGSGTASFALGHGFENARLNLNDVVVSPIGLPVGRIAAQRVQLGGARSEAPESDRLMLSLAAEAVQLPPGIETPLGSRIAAASVDARLDDPVPLPARPETLAAWSQAGGSIQVDSARLDWGPLLVAAEGTLTLDEQFRPEGRLDASLTGLSETLDALVEAGLMRSDNATLAKVAVGFLARRENAEGAPVVDAPVVLRDGWLSLGPVRLARLQPVVR